MRSALPPFTNRSFYGILNTIIFCNYCIGGTRHGETVCSHPSLPLFAGRIGKKGHQIKISQKLFGTVLDHAGAAAEHDRSVGGLRPAAGIFQRQDLPRIHFGRTSALHSVFTGHQGGYPQHSCQRRYDQKGVRPQIPLPAFLYSV